MSETLFFRVKRTSVPHALEVQLRKRLRVGSHRIDGMYLWPAEHETPDAGLEYVKVQLLRRNRQQDAQRSPEREALALLGDHDLSGRTSR